MVFKPPVGRARWEGVVVCSWLILLEALLLVLLVSRPVDWVSFMLILLIAAGFPLLLHLAHRTFSLFSLEYWVDRNAVTVRWSLFGQVIPIESIEQIVDGALWERKGSSLHLWPALFIRQGRTFDTPNLRMLASEPLDRCIVLDAGAAGRFALSPTDHVQFIQEIQARRLLGATKTVIASELRPAWCRTPFWKDPISRGLLIAGTVGVLALFGTLMLRYPELPDMLAFHYNRQGNPDLIQAKSFLFLIPMIGLLAWLTNGIGGIFLACRSGSSERYGAYLLWGGTVTVEVVSFLAMVNLIGR